MTELVLAVVLLVLAALVVTGCRAATSRRRVSRLRGQLVKADRQLDREHRVARRAMNAAAGQSWRNLVEKDRGGA